MNWNSIKLIAPICLAICACSKEQHSQAVLEDGVQVTGGTSLTVMLPDQATKTALGEKTGGKYPTIWQEGDCLQLNGFSSLPLEAADAGAASAPFVFRDGLASPFNLLYPVSGEKGLVVFPATQNYTPGSFDPKAAPMWGTSTSYSDITLHHYSSLVRISITSQEKRVLRSITLTALGGEPLSGRFLAGTDESGAFNGTLTAVEGEPTVVCSLGEEGLTINAGETATIYIAVPQGNYSQGFKAVVQSATYEYRLLNFFTAGRSISPGKVLEFPEKDFDDIQVVWEYFVSATGTGDGFGAASPMSVADMVTLLKEGGEDKINGATFHFTAGSHVLTAPIILPGKDTYSKAITYVITGDNQATVSGGGSSQIFIVNADNSHVTVKDITLTNGSSSASGGLVTIQEASPLFEHCSFTNTNNSGNTGGAIRISEADKGNGLFKSCVFSGNKGSNGGAVVITNANTAVTFVDCTFTENTSASDGGVIYATNGITTFEGCVFDKNTGKNGGVISATAGTFHINGCKFSNNSASTNAGAIYAADKQKPLLYINACSFIDNTATSNGYSIYLNTSTAGNFASLCVNNSTFYNSADMNGTNASVVCNKGKSLILNSTFYGKTTKWGTYALGCHKNHGDLYGCLFLNSIFVNTASGKPAVYQTGANYYAIARNCIISLSSDNTQFTRTDVTTTVPSLTWNGSLFSWDGNTTLPKLGKADIEAILSDDNYSLGADFLAWLSGLGALDADQRGAPRSGYIWAGSYQD